MVSSNEKSSFFSEKSAISIIKRDVMECNLPFRGDTYDGCYHNCIYCYARYLKEQIYKNWYSDNPRPANIIDLKKRFDSGFQFHESEKRSETYYVNRAIKHGFPIRLGTHVDCFQECEKKKDWN
jgi:DNA repair photolyase